MTAPAHPFDGELKQLDPQTHRITPCDFPDGRGSANITLLVYGRPMQAIDLVARGRGERLELLSVTPLPIVFVTGPGGHNGGAVEPYVIAAEPCRCTNVAHQGTRWNPLTLGLMWHDGLPPRLVQLSRAYSRNILANLDQYCPWGLKAIANLRRP